MKQVPWDQFLYPNPSMVTEASAFPVHAAAWPALKVTALI